MSALAKLSPHAQHTAPFHHMALEVHKLLNKPLGTEHARILKLAEVLKNLAETNYHRGHEDALASLEIVPGGATDTPTQPETLLTVEHAQVIHDLFNANPQSHPAAESLWFKARALLLAQGTAPAPTTP